MASETRSSPKKEAVLSKAALNAAKHLGLNQSELAKLLGISDSLVFKLAAFEYFIDPCELEGERALMLVQIFRALDALVGGDASARITWMNAHNKVIYDLPRHAVQTLSGLKRTLAYLHNLVSAASTGQASPLQ